MCEKQTLTIGKHIISFNYGSATSSFKTTRQTSTDAVMLPKVYLLRNKKINSDPVICSRYGKAEFYARISNCFGGIPE